MLPCFYVVKSTGVPAMFVCVCSALICEKYVLLPACLQVFPWLAPTRGAAQLSFLGITATTPSPPPPALSDMIMFIHLLACLRPVSPSGVHTPRSRALPSASCVCPRCSAQSAGAQGADATCWTSAEPCAPHPSGPSPPPSVFPPGCNHLCLSALPRRCPSVQLLRQLQDPHGCLLPRVPPLPHPAAPPFITHLHSPPCKSTG